jgi:hypothetical protein
VNKAFKILIIIFISLLILAFTGWQTFNYFWRTKSTVNTFSEFIEPDSVSFSPIIWRKGNFGGVSTDIGSFFVKVELNGVNESFYMQFDTGASQTVLYGRILNQLKEKYPNLAPSKNSSGNDFFKDAQLKIGDAILETDYLRILSNMGSNKIDSSFNIIGTVGFDAIYNRKLILDFKQNRLAITNRKIEDLNYPFQELKGASLDRFPILIPAEVDGENVQLWFDTGSSMFSLITAEQKLQDIENASTIDTLCCISVWGKSYDFYRRKLNSEIKIGNLTNKNPDVFATENMNQIANFPNWLVMGITGNQMFLDKVLLIDPKNNYFGISD